MRMFRFVSRSIGCPSAELRKVGHPTATPLAVGKRRIWFALMLLVCGAGVPAGSHAAPLVTFDQPLYTVKPGEAFDATILIDGEVGMAGIQPLANGLFSFGLEMTFLGSDATATNIAVVNELDFFGFAAGASTLIGSGFVDAEGNIDQVGLLLPYTGSSLATVTLVNNAPVGSSYFLLLAAHPHFPTEQLFLDGLGTVLDTAVVFGSARVFVIPEPSTACLALFALGCAFLGCVRRIRPRQR